MTSFNDGIEAAADKLKELAASLRKYGYPEKAEVLEEVAIPISALKRPEPSEAVPADVRRLVVAARIVAFEDQSPEAIKELDAASEAFADRVPWDDEPEHRTELRKIIAQVAHSAGGQQ